VLCFAQEAGEELFRNRYIPYGGLILALLWGTPHILYHGITNGLFAVFGAIIYGIVYVVLEKNYKYAYPIIFFMFIM